MKEFWNSKWVLPQAQLSLCIRRKVFSKAEGKEGFWEVLCISICKILLYSFSRKNSLKTVGSRKLWKRNGNMMHFLPFKRTLILTSPNVGLGLKSDNSSYLFSFLYAFIRNASLTIHYSIFLLLLACHTMKRKRKLSREIRK